METYWLKRKFTDFIYTLQPNFYPLKPKGHCKLLALSLWSIIVCLIVLVRLFSVLFHPSSREFDLGWKAISSLKQTFPLQKLKLPLFILKSLIFPGYSSPSYLTSTKSPTCRYLRKSDACTSGMGKFVWFSNLLNVSESSEYWSENLSSSSSLLLSEVTSFFRLFVRSVLRSGQHSLFRGLKEEHRNHQRPSTKIASTLGTTVSMKMKQTTAHLKTTPIVTLNFKQQYARHYPLCPNGIYSTKWK